MATWFKNQDKFDIISYVLQLLIDPTYNVPVELKFTQIAQASEAFHRRFLDSSGTSSSRKEAIKPYLDYLHALFKHEKKCCSVDSGLQKLINNKLRFAHELTFGDRLNQLINELPNQIKSITLVNIPKFTETITQIRNYYTHWDETNKNNFSFQKIHDFTETLRVLLLISLLKYIGLTDAVLIDAFNRYKYVCFNRSLLENVQRADNLED